MINYKIFKDYINSIKIYKYKRIIIPIKNIEQKYIEYFNYLCNFIGINNHNIYYSISYFDILEKYNLIDNTTYSLENINNFLEDYYANKIEIKKIPKSVHDFLNVYFDNENFPKFLNIKAKFDLINSLIKCKDKQIVSIEEYNQKYNEYYSSNLKIFLYIFRNEYGYKNLSLLDFNRIISKQLKELNKNEKIIIDDNYLYNYLCNFIETHKLKSIKYLREDIKEYLINEYRKDISNIWEKIYLCINKDYVKPKCGICGNDVRFISFDKGYDTVCSYTCKLKEAQLKRESTFEIKYGVKNNFLLEKNKNKAKLSMISKYGVDNVFKTSAGQDKCKTTLKQKYGGIGASSEIIKSKMEETNLKKYGWRHNWQDPEEQKRSHSIEAKNKQKETCKLKYGYEFSIQSPEVREKVKQTWINNYGVPYLSQNKLILEKVNETKRKNGTFNTSKDEKQSFELLKLKFKYVEYQYKDNERYPFNCDFYIPSFDLFIECQYSWTHGGHPYNKENDKEKIELWENKAKKSKYYQNAIETWTIRDVSKRETAKKNNLNYLEFFTIIELQNWLNTFNEYEGDK